MAYSVTTSKSLQVQATSSPAVTSAVDMLSVDSSFSVAPTIEVGASTTPAAATPAARTAAATPAARTAAASASARTARLAGFSPRDAGVVAAARPGAPASPSSGPARAVLESSTKPPIFSNVGSDDASQDNTSLPASKKDLHLTGSHGLTSLYPSILLTSPRTSRLLDTNTGLTSTPFIIDLNNTIKKSIESSVNDAINTYTPILSLTNVPHDKNVQNAKIYANKCVLAALEKDRLIRLTNIINMSAMAPEGNTNVRIGNKPYDFLNGSSTVLSYVKYSINYDFSDKDFTTGSASSVNTKALVIFFKILYFKFLNGLYHLSYTHAEDLQSEPDKLQGYSGFNTSRSLYYLKKISDSGTSNIENLTIDYIRGDYLPDIVRTIQRDLIMQGAKERIMTFLRAFRIGQGTTATSAQQALSFFIGAYKDDEEVEFSTFISGYDTIQEFSSDRLGDTAVVPILSKQDAGKTFNVLDSAGGHDYLLYNELGFDVQNANLDKLTTFCNEYTSFASKLSSFYQLIYKDDETRQTSLNMISSEFLMFFRRPPTSESGITIFGILCIASQNEKFALSLFQFMCQEDAANESSRARSESRWEFLAQETLGKIFAESRGVLTEYYVNEGTSTYAKRTLGINAPEVLIETDWFYASVSSLFGMFHLLSKLIETALAGGTMSDYNRKTSFSSNINRNARAFVYYQIFLDMIRDIYFNIRLTRSSADDNASYRILIQYLPEQMNPITWALENCAKDYGEFTTSLYAAGEDVQDVPSELAEFRTEAIKFHSKYLYRITSSINEQEQSCLDIINIIVSHAYQISARTSNLRLMLGDVRAAATQAGLQNKESILNSIQAEQAFLKQHLVNQYSRVLDGAEYLPAAIDHNIGQANNTKTIVTTMELFKDDADISSTKKFLIAVAMPTGLLENLRYQSVSNVSEHHYDITLHFKKLQRSDDEETEYTVTYPFSSRVFVIEGSVRSGGADIYSSELTNYAQIREATRFAVTGDDGTYYIVESRTIENVLSFVYGTSDRATKIIDNLLMSHYAKLLLKTAAGISLDEEGYDLVPQIRNYPDTDQVANYTTIVDGMVSNNSDTPEGQINKERAMRDLSRAIPLSPTQHKTSMMVAKTFERIHVIAIDTSTFPSWLELENDNTFISVVASVSLAGPETNDITSELILRFS